MVRPQNVERTWIFVGLVLTASVVAPLGVTETGGGTVENTAPQPIFFDNVDREPFSDETGLFTALFYDPNGEADIILFHLFEAQDGIEKLVYEVTAGDLQRREDPGGMGWRVWDPEPGDGALYVAVAIAYPPGDATYLMSMGAADEVWVTNADFIEIRVSGVAPIDATIVDFEGNPFAGARWGGWRATAGAVFPRPTNALKIVNGQQEDAQLVLDFTSTSFFGPRGNIAIDENILIRTFEDTTPDTTSPQEATGPALDFSDSPQPQSLASSGSVTLSFQGAENIMYVTYSVFQLPPLLADDEYQATYTVTRL